MIRHCDICDKALPIGATPIINDYNNPSIMPVWAHITVSPADSLLKEGQIQEKDICAQCMLKPFPVLFPKL